MSGSGLAAIALRPEYSSGIYNAQNANSPRPGLFRQKPVLPII